MKLLKFITGYDDDEEDTDDKDFLSDGVVLDAVVVVVLLGSPNLTLNTFLRCGMDLRERSFVEICFSN